MSMFGDIAVEGVIERLVKTVDDRIAQTELELSKTSDQEVSWKLVSIIDELRWVRSEIKNVDY